MSVSRTDQSEPVGEDDAVRVRVILQRNATALAALDTDARCGGVANYMENGAVWSAVVLPLDDPRSAEGEPDA